MAYNSKTGGDDMKLTALAGGRHRAPLRPLPAMDLPFLVLVLTLVGFGLVMLGSASGAVALYRRGDAFAYLRPQLLYAAMGIAGLWLASRVDYHIFHKLAWPLLGVSLVLLVVVLFMPEYNGCKRWLVLPGVGTLQPSEIAKFAVVLVFSHIISLNHDRMRSFVVGVLPFVLVLGVVAALMLLEPHLSGTLLILGIGAVLMFVGGTGLRWFVLAGVGGAAAIGAAVVVMPDLVPYAADRLRSWQDPFADPLGDGHQTIQSLYAIGSGGATGLGLGNSRQKHLFVPEPQNDFIFSIVCEELGFVGACAVVLLFVLLLWRGWQNGGGGAGSRGRAAGADGSLRPARGRDHPAFPQRRGHRDASAGRCLCQGQDHPAGSGPGTGDRRPCRFSEPVRRLHRGGGQLHDPHRRAAGPFRVLLFAPARPHFCFHAGLRLCGSGRPGGTDRLRPCALCTGAGNSGTNGVPGGTGGGYGANFPLWAAARGRPGVHRSLSGPCH